MFNRGTSWRSRERRTREAIERGDTLLAQGELDAAEAAYQQALALTPDSAEALYSVGCVASHRRDFTESLEWARRALQADGGHQGARALAGNALLAMERYVEALDMLSDGTREDDLVTRVHIALCHEGLGELAVAENELRSVLEHDPAYVTRHAALAMYDQSPFWADVHAHLARVLRLRGADEEARLHYHLAKRIDPTVELDPGYLEIMSREDLEDHPIDRHLTETWFDALDLSTFGDQQEQARTLLRLAHSPDADTMVRGACELNDLERQSLLPIAVTLIHGAQQTGSFRLSAALRAVVDELAEGTGRALFTAVHSGPWQRLLEVAELLHAGSLREEEALATAYRDDQPLLTPNLLVPLLRRFTAIDAATALPLARVAAAALDASADPVHGLTAQLLVARTWSLTGDLSAAERTLRDVVNRVEEASDHVSEDGAEFTRHHASEGAAHRDVLLDALSMLGGIQANRGHHARAVDTLRRYAESADCDGDWEHRFFSRYNLASALGGNGEIEEAHAEARRAAEALRLAPVDADVAEYTAKVDALIALTDPHGGAGQEKADAHVPVASMADSVDSLRSRARELHAHGRTQDALHLLEQAADAALGQGRRSLVGEIELESGTMLVALSDFGRAREVLKRCLLLLPESHALYRARAHLELARVHQEENRTDDAVEALRQATPAAYRADDAWTLVEVHMAWNDVLKEREPEAAFHHHAISQRMRGGEAATESAVRSHFTALTERARAVHGVHDDLTAMATVYEMEQEVGALDRGSDRCTAALVTGETLLALAQPQWAERLLLDALSLATSLQWRDLEAELDAREALGMAYRHSGRAAEAIDQYRAALRLSEELYDDARAAALHGYLAIALRYDDQLDAAADAYQQAIAMLRSFGREREVAVNRMNLAATLLLLGRRDQAIQLAVTNLDDLEAQGNEDFVMRTLALLATMSASSDELSAHAAERLRVGATRSTDPALRAWLWTDRAQRLLDDGDIDGAERELGRAIDVHHAHHNSANEVMARLNRARLLHDLRPDTAQADAEQAYGLALDTGQDRLTADAETELLRLALTRGDTADVARLLNTLTERWTAQRRALRQDRDRVALADQAVPLIKGCAEHFLRLGDTVRAFDTLDHARALGLTDLLVIRQRQGLPEAARKPLPSATNTTRALLRAMSVPAMAVTLDMMGGRPVLGVLRADAARPEFLDADMTEAEVAALLDTFRLEMLDYGGDGPQTWPGTLRRLLKPALERIQEGELVVLVPEGELQQLPLHAATYANGSPLVERAPIVHAPSIAALDLALRTPRPPADPLARLVTVGVAFPDEARAVSLAFGGPCMSGRNLDKETVRKSVQDACLVHFSCHGYFDAHDFLDSGLLLRTTDNPMRGDILSLRDLNAWRLRADLVVLSACETGQGRAVPSDFLGLARGVLAAGARAVLATLWPVRDSVTQSLMLELYRDMVRQRDETGLIDVSLALATVQRRASRTLPPYDWAAFKLIGWPRIEWSQADERDPSR
ncbi:CHAT domain-containing protein [Streptomyces sp. NPDC001137]|uniref:CHAT domain-containing protein n=1 Tax=Streptomyces sp. NPDC001137 TaxID=3154378 RepID=UPI003327477B